MRGTSIVISLLVAISPAIADPRWIQPSRPGGTSAATTGIAIGSAATSLATGLASKTLGIAGEALGKIPIVGPLAKIGTSLGQAGVSAGNALGQMGLGIAQSAVDIHRGYKPGLANGGSVGIGQNVLQGITGATEVIEGTLNSLQQQIGGRQNNMGSSASLQQTSGNLKRPRPQQQAIFSQLLNNGDSFRPQRISGNQASSNYNAQKFYDYFEKYNNYDIVGPSNLPNAAATLGINSNNRPPRPIYIGYNK